MFVLSRVQGLSCSKLAVYQPKPIKNDFIKNDRIKNDPYKK
jgi:hypothetical protein